MEKKLIQFRSFSTEEEAITFSKKLTEHGILCEVIKNVLMIDKSIIGNSSDFEFHVKIKSTDFEKANKVLDEIYSTEVNAIDKDYFLYQFTIAELKDVVAKADEWGNLNVQLALKILKDKGIEIHEVEIQKLKEHRLVELSKNENSSPLIIFAGYFFAVAGAILGFWIGASLYFSKNTLPNGEQVYNYSKFDRNHGYIIMGISILAFIFGMITIIFR